MAAFDLESRQYDVINAYPQVPIDEETYCKPPPGMKIKDGLVLLLLRALYGLKQSPALWQKHLSTTLQNLGFTEVPEAPCLFTNEHMILFFFVDNIVIIYHKDHTAYVNDFQRKLFEIYEIRYLSEIQCVNHHHHCRYGLPSFVSFQPPSFILLASHHQDTITSCTLPTIMYILPLQHYSMRQQ
ncbi:Reverse transcriptase RNA-dependent DNA polymerase [Macrophomina phaseolina MS6]|uniref:Reverse transcriptase RNA-dependent DNA polymerase n=1 Tax=Macrophomina phaseolina (strain MS6) TaxID=1126212 RepID=K2SPC3_MACPH|nr:Reverse transcriptase RNA-dependent DNA polymerase [Macrophomina phaseolina MS6]